MKILQAPANIASMPGITVKALNEIGHEAVLLSVGTHRYHTRNQYVKTIEAAKKENIFKWLRYWFLRLYYLWKYVRWADVIHWYCDAHWMEMLIIKIYKKPAIIEWCGSDIRIPELEINDNPYYKEVYENAGYEYKSAESLENSVAIQKKFKAAKFYPLLSSIMSVNLRPEIFPAGTYSATAVLRIDLENYLPKYPDPDCKRPVLLHMPSALGAKGTKYIIEAVDRLKQKYDFDFQLVHNMSRKEALDKMRNCDVFIDQIIYGHHGMAAVEAMAFGKPVICYIKESMKKNYPADLPILSANPSDVYEQMERCLKEPQLRYDVGVKGRLYVEKYHECHKVASNFVECYQNVIDSHKREAVS